MSITPVSSGPRAGETIKTWVNSQSKFRHLPGQLSVEINKFSSNVVFGQPYIRGIGSNQLNIGSDPDVATIIDGIYIARPVGSVQNFLDVDHVEVLKGPQGTLYGRNATGGVISIISKVPTRDWTGEIETGIGNYTDISGHAAIGGPLVKDRVLVRLAIGGESRDGYFYNVFDKSRIDNLGVLQGRATVDILPAEGWRVRLIGDFLRERDSRGAAAFVTAPGPATLNFGQPILSSRFVADENAPLGNVIDGRGVSATIDKDFGAFTATSITGYRYSAYSSRLDLDFTSFNFADNQAQTEKSKTFTQELRLASSPGGRFSWIAGLYYLNEDATTSNNYTFYTSNSVLVIAGATRTKAYAGFGQISYNLTDKLKLTAGGRYSDETRSANVSSRTVATSTFAGSASYHAFTPKFGIDYTVSPNVLLYASATRGFKSGGFNATSTTNPPFLPEGVWSYEAGFKTELFDRRLRLNGSAFYMDYSNLQVIVSVPGKPSTINNAASARIKGAELEAQLQVGGGLTLNAGLSLLDAKYKQYQSIDSERPALGVIDLSRDSHFPDRLKPLSRSVPHTTSTRVRAGSPPASTTATRPKSTTCLSTPRCRRRTDTAS
jgi:iron complex outermembrane receptor protein